MGHGLGGVRYFFQHVGSQRERGQNAGGIPGVDAGRLDMLHDAADDGPVPVGNGIHVHFNGILQELVDENRISRRSQDGQSGKVLQFLPVVDDFHGPAAKHV